MIIVLTGGTKKSRQEMMVQISAYVEYTHIEGETYAEQKSNLLHHLHLANNLLVTNCFLKSQRYEIFCIAKRFNLSYCVIVDETETDFEAYEVPNARFVYDKPMYNSATLHEINKIKTIKRNNKAHTKKIHVSSDYFVNVQQIIKTINKEFESKSYVLKECEQKLYNILQVNNVCIDEIETCYKKIIQNELENKNIQ
ncbi:hypothetical protein BDAP_000125 [Binucleata daphniae]